MSSRAKFWVLISILWSLLGFIAVEIAVIYIRRGYFFIFIMSVWIICWIIVYLLAKKEVREQSIKKPKKKFDNKK